MTDDHGRILGERVASLETEVRGLRDVLADRFDRLESTVRERGAGGSDCLAERKRCQKSLYRRAREAEKAAEAAEAKASEAAALAGEAKTAAEANRTTWLHAVRYLAVGTFCWMIGSGNTEAVKTAWNMVLTKIGWK